MKQIKEYLGVLIQSRTSAFSGPLAMQQFFIIDLCENFEI
jgi:hypothetical protein